MTDREFLIWVYERLRFVHKENPNIDYMGKLRSVIMNIPEDQSCGNTVGSDHPKFQ